MIPIVFAILCITLDVILVAVRLVIMKQKRRQSKHGTQGRNAMSNRVKDATFAINISVEDRTVFIDFPKPVSWVGMDKRVALQLADVLIEHANKIRDRTKEN